MMEQRYNGRDATSFCCSRVVFYVTVCMSSLIGLFQTTLTNQLQIDPSLLGLCHSLQHSGGGGGGGRRGKTCASDS